MTTIKVQKSKLYASTRLFTGSIETDGINSADGTLAIPASVYAGVVSGDPIIMESVYLPRPIISKRMYWIIKGATPNEIKIATSYSNAVGNMALVLQDKLETEEDRTINYTIHAGLTKVNGIRSGSLPSGSTPILDSSTWDDDGMDKEGGLLDEGQATYEMNYDPNDEVQLQLQKDRTDVNTRMFREVLSNDISVKDFVGIITNFTDTKEKGELVRIALTIEIKGRVEVYKRI